MNERGIVSLTALCIMFMLAITIATVSNIATHQANIAKFYKTETKLQYAAESAFSETVTRLILDPTYYEHLKGDLDIENTTSSWSLSIEGYVDEVTANIYMKKYHTVTPNSPNENEDTHNFMIVIVVLSEKANYLYNNKSVYKRVYGYMSRKLIRNRETNEIVHEDDYEFKEYLY